MSSGGCEEGNCRICGSYTKNINYKWYGVCLACHNKLERSTKEDLLYKIYVLERQVKKLRKELNGYG